jgi:hypothetical protein
MPERLRYYLAGALHATAGVWIIGWAAGHWVGGLSRAFGPTGWLPAPLALALVFAGFGLIGWGRAPGGLGRDVRRGDAPDLPAAGR